MNECKQKCSLSIIITETLKWKTNKEAKRELTLEQFKHLAQPQLWCALKADTASGKGFEVFHNVIFKKAGIWLEKCTPISRKLDANLAS